MSFFDKIKNMMTMSEEDEYYEEEDTATDYDFSSSSADYGRSERTREKTTAFPLSKSKDKEKVYSTAPMQVALVKPERFEDAPAIADHINDKRTVVLNLESANNETKRRLLDFLSGAAYANNGRIKRVANNTFIITPNNVDVMGELLLGELDGTASTTF